MASSQNSTLLGAEIFDNRDVTNTDQINETVRYYGELVFKQLKNILGEAYPLILRPIGNGFAGFFKGEDGHYRIYQPISNIAMIPGNAACWQMVFCHYIQKAGSAYQQHLYLVD